MSSILPGGNNTAWTRFLEYKYHEVELGALKDETVLDLSSFLDMKIRSLDNGKYSDYTGLADVIGLNFGFVESLRQETLQTYKVIREWQRGRSAKWTPSVGLLVRALLRLNREDVVSECISSFSRDAKEYLANRHISRVPDSTNHDMLTVDDSPGKPAFYDAFIIYNEESDRCEFIVNEIAKTLENSPYHLRFFFPRRNGLFGVVKLDNYARVLKKRCKHAIVVLSSEYNSCEISSFVSSMAVMLSTRDHRRHVVPILINGYQKSQMPDVLKVHTEWNFPGTQDPSQWRKLALSVCRFL